MCNCGAEKEDNKEYLVHCPTFEVMRADLFGHLSEMPALDIVSMNSKILCSILLYGWSQLDNVTDRMILDAYLFVLCYIALLELIIHFCFFLTFVYPF